MHNSSFPGLSMKGFCSARDIIPILLLDNCLTNEQNFFPTCLHENSKLSTIRTSVSVTSIVDYSYLGSAI